MRFEFRVQLKSSQSIRLKKLKIYVYLDKKAKFYLVVQFLKGEGAKEALYYLVVTL